MMRTILLVDADHDLITSYFKVSSDKVVQQVIGNANIRIVRLTGADATKTNVQAIIAAEEPAVVILNGHGNQGEICGFNYEVLVKAGDNSHILAARHTHGMVCSAGHTLGPDIITAGGLSYIGYTDAVKFLSMYGGNPTNAQMTSDQYGALQMHPPFVAIKSLIEGDTPDVAFKKSQRSYAETVAKLRASKSTTLNTIMAAVVDHNWQCQVLLPNP